MSGYHPIKDDKMPEKVYEESGVNHISELEPEIVKALNSKMFRDEFMYQIKSKLIEHGK